MVFRFAIFVGLGSVVATIIYLTPVPEQTFLSCDRPCHHLDWPMICRVKLTLEVFQSLSKSCGDCPANETACLANHCVSADGQKRGLLTANRQMPGPSIQVCENDILVVDVVNRLPGKAAAVHWRGQSQIETPCMDGAPLITQCPIPSYTTFQYKFRAAAPGTHLWHAHSGADMADGIFGSLIVRQADLRELHRALYDIDDPNHVMLITQWQHTAGTDANFKSSIILVNGKGRQPGGPQVPLTTFKVIPGRRHRFRVANAGGSGSCPMMISIDDHPLLVIALDGHPVSPQQVTSISLAKGERVDFVLKTNKRIFTYRINVEASEACEDNILNGEAILKYKGSPEVNLSEKNKIAHNDDIDNILQKELAMTTNIIENCENPVKLCLTEMKAMRKMYKSLTKKRMDVTLYLPINYKIQSADFTGSGQVDARVLNVDNATFTFPSSPLLTQRDDVAQGLICGGGGDSDGDETRASGNCRRDAGNESPTCECVHVRRIPLGATVEIILLDQGGLDDLVYHLHGYSFHVVAARKFGKSIALKDIKDLDEDGALFSRNLDCAPLKDTVTVPKYGAVALRFKADNPGFWMLRDEHASGWTRGLDLILQVGEQSDMIPPPEDFPKCGSFVGPDYFLI
ncbi:laccase-4 isoform X2 [Cephus cinctus]|uniref:Laccase-4 isoform X2 n=1 Tax=Cephus cinctus TaxID=211228 RepID=A0AAJ7C634_CEPCN|nr:laccase-4 isoform X2 [Cephus cinctus]